MEGNLSRRPALRVCVEGCSGPPASRLTRLEAGSVAVASVALGVPGARRRAAFELLGAQAPAAQPCPPDQPRHLHRAHPGAIRLSPPSPPPLRKTTPRRRATAPRTTRTLSCAAAVRRPLPRRTNRPVRLHALRASLFRTPPSRSRKRDSSPVPSQRNRAPAPPPHYHLLNNNSTLPAPKKFPLTIDPSLDDDEFLEVGFVSVDGRNSDWRIGAESPHHT